jgi:GNAT superfamily N-acetyltransferase
MPHATPPTPTDAITISDDRTRVDLDQLLDLYRETWWAKNRDRADVERALAHSHPLITAWVGPRMVGFSRVISDLTYRATIWDVIVRPDLQGRGVGKRMMQAVLDHPDLENVTMFLLLTKDQHRFYAGLGFTHEKDMSMMLRR